MDSIEKENSERCTNIEIKLSYLEEFVQKLQDEVVKQGKTIDKLTKENRLISGKLQDVLDSLEEIPNRKPPHY